jgi:hypothetical protein
MSRLNTINETLLDIFSNERGHKVYSSALNILTSNSIHLCYIRLLINKQKTTKNDSFNCYYFFNKTHIEKHIQIYT